MVSVLEMSQRLCTRDIFYTHLFVVQHTTPAVLHAMTSRHLCAWMSFISVCLMMIACFASRRHCCHRVQSTSQLLAGHSDHSMMTYSKPTYWLLRCVTNNRPSGLCLTQVDGDGLVKLYDVAPSPHDLTDGFQPEQLIIIIIIIME